MNCDFTGAFITGIECVSSWSSVLDRINVFPIADGDTGRNLVCSLAPLRHVAVNRERTVHELLLSARGNAGNIAARFFQAFIWTDTFEDLHNTIKKGRDQAWQTIGDPQPGTMLTFFDALTDVIGQNHGAADRAWVSHVMDRLVEVVRSTTAMQPSLEDAGVIDAGALGMFLYFDGFLNALIGNTSEFCPIMSLFNGRLQPRHFPDKRLEYGHCVDMVLSSYDGVEKDLLKLSQRGENIVVIRDEAYVKVHLHTRDRDQIRKDFETTRNMIRWSDDDLKVQTAAFQSSHGKQAVHIMTDAAGSLTRDDARALNITLLDSYINIGGMSLPESYVSPEVVYHAMRKGENVSTSQASVFERHQCYQSVVSIHGKTLYLCVGSGYTGNYETAIRWKREHGLGDSLVIIDTGCASGRLGLLAAVTAKYAYQTVIPEDVISFAAEAANRCQEYIFIDKLQYLAAGGRLSKRGAFFGDIMHMKPVISPQPDGARKIGVLRNRRDQMAFAMKKLSKSLTLDSRSAIWLEYSDNGDWVAEEIIEQIRKQYPLADLAMKPISLTTGVHVGPGTWAITFYSDR
ncbi:MAG: DegV family protein [Syntrophales bacterium]